MLNTLLEWMLDAGAPSSLVNLPLRYFEDLSSGELHGDRTCPALELDPNEEISALQLSPLDVSHADACECVEESLKSNPRLGRVLQVVELFPSFEDLLSQAERWKEFLEVPAAEFPAAEGTLAAARREQVLHTTLSNLATCSALVEDLRGGVAALPTPEPWLSDWVERLGSRLDRAVARLEADLANDENRTRIAERALREVLAEPLRARQRLFAPGVLRLSDELLVPFGPAGVRPVLGTDLTVPSELEWELYRRYVLAHLEGVCAADRRERLERLLRSYARALDLQDVSLPELALVVDSGYEELLRSLMENETLLVLDGYDRPGAVEESLAYTVRSLDGPSVLNVPEVVARRLELNHLGAKLFHWVLLDPSEPDSVAETAIDLYDPDSWTFDSLVRCLDAARRV